MKNKKINVVDNIHEFCIKYGFRYDNDKYIKYISNDSEIVIKLQDDYLNLYIKVDNIKGENPNIIAVEKLSINSIKSFIYNDSLDMTLCKLIIYNINKIYNKILFNNENNLIYF